MHVFDDGRKLLKPVESRCATLRLSHRSLPQLLRAMKNLLGISCIIRLNEQIERLQAPRDRRKRYPSASIRLRFIHARKRRSSIHRSIGTCERRGLAEPAVTNAVPLIGLDGPLSKLAPTAYI